MDIRQAIQAAAQDPRFQQALEVAKAELSDASPEQIEELIQLFEMMMERPADYGQILAAAVQDDMVEAGDLPEQFDPTIIASLLVVLYKLREGGGEAAAFARGGLAGARTLARQGRMGDTMLAHISPEEAAMLKARGGAGTINPNTGLPQYFSLKSFVKAVLPVALTFIAPGIGSAIGGAILGAGASATAMAAMGSAVLGGLGSALTGGNVLQGALLGGLTGGLGGMVGGAVAPTMSNAAQSIIGSGIVGGVAGAATGQGFAKGALQGAGGAYLGQQFGQLGGAGYQSAGKTFGNMLAAGYDPKTAVIGGGLSGLATSMMPQQPAPTTQAARTPITSDLPGYEGKFAGQGLKPSDAVVEGLKMPQGTPGEMARFGTTNYLTGEQGVIPGQAPQLVAPTAAPVAGMEGITGTGLTPPADALALPTPAPGFQMPSVSTLGKLALVGSLAGSRPEGVNQAIAQMSPDQQEYFNRPNVNWDWNKLQNDAAAANMSLSQYMASYWPQVSGGMYNAVPKLAAGGMYAAGGGPLNAVARLVRGGGSGRDDTINARLSDGEYVMDAETVAMLGDGSTDEGARRLDAMRAQLRKHKGKTLARGEFSPNAKSPLAYLKGKAK